LAALLLLNRTGVRNRVPYLLLGLVLWVAVLKSGVHATVAGVLLAMMIPSRIRVDTGDFLARSHDALDAYEHAADPISDPLPVLERQQTAAQALEDASDEVESPLHSLEHDLHPWVSYLILPLFALANAGVPLGGDLLADLAQPVSLGIILGLALGKPVGISLMAWLGVRLGLTTLPDGLRWRHVIGGGWLAGIGFTMSVFIATLAFGDPVLLTTAKAGILVASLLAGAVGALWLRVGVSAPGPSAEE
jgi:NhaA family Na+:H+ antiporter